MFIFLNDITILKGLAVNAFFWIKRTANYGTHPRKQHMWSPTCWALQQKLRLHGSATWARTRCQILFRGPAPSATLLTENAESEAAPTTQTRKTSPTYGYGRVFSDTCYLNEASLTYTALVVSRTIFQRSVRFYAALEYLSVKLSFTNDN